MKSIYRGLAGIEYLGGPYSVIEYKLCLHELMVYHVLSEVP